MRQRWWTTNINAGRISGAGQARYISYNPADDMRLPPMQGKEINPLSEDEQEAFVKAIAGHDYEALYLVALFTGMREGELCGLTWDAVNFKESIITVDKQLQRQREGENAGKYIFLTPKSGKTRKFVAADMVMTILRHQKVIQAEKQLLAGPAWSNDYNLVFTNGVGHNLSPQTLYLRYKKIVTSIGRPDARLHDLRHTYATMSLADGADIKSIQEQLGHWSATFTLSTYAHSTEKMKRDAAEKTNERMKRLLG